ncbi:MAG TPA: hypothetical protein VNF73_14695, partial [Candidatus Saccharimonadales bacterium]|nr:hypothetical protein [Candidatus Saccharimonadales bacterium]
MMNAPKLVDLWLLKAPGQRLSDEVGTLLTAESVRRGWTVEIREASAERDQSGRPIAMVRPADAGAIYSRAHTARVGLLVDDRLRVSLDPTKAPAIRRARNLGSFLRYKAFVSRLDYSEPREAVQFIEAFAVWANLTDCEGDYDPRILPLHIFDAESE